MPIVRSLRVDRLICRRLLILIGMLGVAMLASVMPGATPAMADTSKPIKFLLSPGVEGHSDRCLQEIINGSYGMQLCSLPNPTPWQRWSVTIITSTKIKLTSAWGTCLTDLHGTLSPEPCFSPVSRQEWDLKYMADGRIEVRNASSGRCLHYSSFSPSVQVSSCLAPVLLNSRWWLWPVPHTSATNNQWRSAGRCAEVLLLGHVAESSCADASKTSQMFNLVPQWPASQFLSGGSTWSPPSYSIRSALPGGYCVANESSGLPRPGGTFITEECEDVGRQRFLIQVLPGLANFRISAYTGTGRTCVNMDHAIDRPAYAECIGTLPDLNSFPTYQRWQFIGLAP
jgi:hypothetical protein